MCGRFGLKTTFSTLAKLLRAEPVADEEWGPDFNIAPTDPAPVLLKDEGPDGAARLDLFRWGLVPFWADDPRVGARMINARADSIATKPAFKESFEKRRLLVPASGWYEWQPGKALAKGADGKPQPWWLHAPSPSASGAAAGADDAGQHELPLMFAGIWAKWRDKASGETRRTFSIVTTDAAPQTAHVHDRMPVILDAAAQATWLDPASDASALKALLVPYAGPLASHMVAKTVNSVKADGPDLIAPLPGDPDRTEKTG